MVHLDYLLDNGLRRLSGRVPLDVRQVILGRRDIALLMPMAET